MTEQQMKPETTADTTQPVAKKKKASWLHTILWMLSMVLLANVVMGIIAYFMFFHDK